MTGTTDSTTRTTDPLMVQPRRQLLIGLALLVVGCAGAAGLVQAGADVAAGPAFVVAVWGLAMIANGFRLMRRASLNEPRPAEGNGFATGGAVALALAFLLPPAGVLVAAYSDPTARRRGQALYPLAIAIGTVLTVLYTMLIIMTAALARSS